MFASCTFKSKSHVRYNENACLAICNAARANNREADITGYLHHEGGYFVGYMEGSMTAISCLTAILQLDIRHSDFQIIDAQQRTTRLFKRWDMAFTDDETRSFSLWAQSMGQNMTLGDADAGLITAFISSLILDHI